MFMLSVVLFGTLVNYGMASNVGRGNWIPVYPLIPIDEKEPEFTQRPRPAPASTTPPARTEAVVSDVKIAHVGREYRRHTSQDPFYADIPDQEIDYIPTSGAESSCKRHEHCYEKREPSEWCILQAGIKYTTRGCFCDKVFGACVIDRSVNGKYEWTFCSEKKNNPCNLL